MKSITFSITRDNNEYVAKFRLFGQAREKRNTDGFYLCDDCIETAMSAGASANFRNTKAMREIEAARKAILEADKAQLAARS